MGVIIVMFTVTAFWIVVGVGGPFIIPKGPNRGISCVTVLFCVMKKFVCLVFLKLILQQYKV